MIQFSRADVDYDLALNAFRNTSQVPIKRARGIVQDYLDHMTALAEEFAGYATDENRAAIEADLERYRAGYIERLTTWLYSHSRVASAFVVGPAKFPTERNRKRSDRADNKRNAFLEYQTKVLKKLRQKYNPDLLARAPIRSDDDGAIEKLEAKLAKLEALQATMKEANRIVRSKKLSDDEKVTQLIDLGLTETAAYNVMAPDQFTDKPGYAKYSLSNNNARIRDTRQRIEDLKKAEAVPVVEDQDYGDFIVRENRGLGKLQIIFEGKPESEVRLKLKRQYGFNWSRKNGAWQRLLNDNARRAAELFVKDYNSK